MADCPLCKVQIPTGNRFCGQCGYCIAPNDLITTIDKRVQETIKNRDVVEIQTAQIAAVKIIEWAKPIGAILGIVVAVLAFFGIKSWYDISATLKEAKAEAYQAVSDMKKEAKEAVDDAKQRAKDAVEDAKLKAKEALDEATSKSNAIEKLNNEAIQKLSEATKAMAAIENLKKDITSLPDKLQIGSFSNHLMNSSEWEVEFDFDVKWAFVIPIGHFENIDWIQAIDSDDDIRRTYNRNGTVTSKVTYRIDKKSNPSKVQVRIVAFGFGRQYQGQEPKNLNESDK